MSFHPDLIDILLRPIRPERVQQRDGGGGKQLSYVEGYDIRATLNRMLGFGNWSVNTHVDIVDQTRRQRDDGTPGAWQVTARAHTRLNIHYAKGKYEVNACYEDVAAALAQNSNLGEAMDQAMKTAATDSLKRCAANLGDQFGLSLYRGGSTRPVVREVVGHEPKVSGTAAPEVQEEQARLQTNEPDPSGMDEFVPEPDTDERPDSGAFQEGQ